MKIGVLKNIDNNDSVIEQSMAEKTTIKKIELEKY